MTITSTPKVDTPSATLVGAKLATFFAVGFLLVRDGDCFVIIRSVYSRASQNTTCALRPKTVYHNSMSASSRQVAIRFDNVSKQFGATHAVKQVSLTIHSGEIVGFVGPNGAGKTTTISLLLGFLRPTVGRISIGAHGTPMTPATAHTLHGDIGYVAGDMALYDNLTGEQYLDFMLHRYKASRARQQELITQLQPQPHTRIRNLSRGNKQKIALIGALQHNPSLLILDEPTSGLDPLMQDTFLQIITDHANKGATVFMSSHILSEVTSVCDRVVFMRSGEVIVDKPTSELEQTSGKRVSLSAVPRTLALMRRQLPPDSHIVSSDTHGLTLTYHGDVTRLIEWLSKHPLKDVTIEDHSLDDIFRGTYTGSTQEKTS